MAHGFQHIPKQRQIQPPDDRPRCPFCHALLNGQAAPYAFAAVWYEFKSPHFCKEVTYGTPLSSLPTIPFK